MVHLTEMRFIISSKIKSGKNNIKANRAGYNCSVESALQNKGSHNASPSKGKLHYCWWCLLGSRMAAEAAGGASLAGAPQVGVLGWHWLQCLRSLLGTAVTFLYRLLGGWSEWMKSSHLMSLFDISNYQLTAVCEVFSLFQQPGCCFPACCSVKIRLLSQCWDAAGWMITMAGRKGES